MTPELIESTANQFALSVFGMLHPDPQDGLPEHVQTLVLLGPQEPGFWAHFTAAPEYLDQAPDAIRNDRLDRKS